MKTTPLYQIHEQFGATFAKKHHDWNVALQFTDAVSEHHTVRNSVGIADVSYRGRYKLAGEDRAKFLHRIISNDVESLSVGTRHVCHALNASRQNYRRFKCLYPRRCNRY